MLYFSLCLLVTLTTIFLAQTSSLLSQNIYLMSGPLHRQQRRNDGGGRDNHRGDRRDGYWRNRGTLGS